MTESISHYLQKAAESLAGAESEFANARYNNAANRCYYACFQAGIAALLAAGLRPTGPQWSHTFVQGRFIGESSTGASATTRLIGCTTCGLWPTMTTSR